MSSFLLVYFSTADSWREMFDSKDGKFLLVRLAYAHKSWTVPGGGVKRNESFEEACHREIKEEIGVKLGPIFKIGEYVSKKEHKTDTVVVFYAALPIEQALILDDTEIQEVGWFAPKNLPHPHMPNVKTILEFYEQFQSRKIKKSISSALAE